MSYRLDPATWELVGENKRFSFTPTEGRILHCLATSPDGFATYSFILAQVWGDDYEINIDYVRVYVYRLRRKLGFDSIESKSGVGIRLKLDIRVKGFESAERDLLELKDVFSKHHWNCKQPKVPCLCSSWRLGRVKVILGIQEREPVRS